MAIADADQLELRILNRDLACELDKTVDPGYIFICRGRYTCADIQQSVNVLSRTAITDHCR